MGSVVVRRGRAKPLWRGHPWVFQDSIAGTRGEPAAGELVTVLDERGREIGCGFWSPRSRIAVRILARGESVAVDKAFFVDRIARAAELRTRALDLPRVTDAYRLIHSEGDFLPGLVVDHFAGRLVVQFSTAGMDLRRELILDALEEVLRPESIHERPDRKACAAEGLSQSAGLRRGREADGPLVVREYELRYRVSLGAGQKTGFFADQRANRRTVGELAAGRSVLDLFTYTGGFGLHAARGGAREVLAVDSSGSALALAAENALLNGAAPFRLERADARAALDRLHREGRRFDMVICDPPRFARDRKGLDRALRAYRDLHLRALRVVERGGLVALSSCSGVVGEEAFEATLREAAHDLGRPVQVLFRGGQAPDHPVLTTCPEGRYLKFLAARAP